MRILFLGEVVGDSGMHVVKTLLAPLKQELAIDYCIVSGNGATGGYGIGKHHALYLRKLGCNLVTGSDAIFNKKDLSNELGQMSFILRPGNLPYKAVGRGWLVATIGDQKVGIINLMGQSGFHRTHSGNPLIYTADLLERKLTDTFTNIVLYHAHTTAEKKTLAYYLAGKPKVSAVMGYASRSQTADHQIIEQTAYITDCGKVGSRHSVVGLEPQNEIDSLMLGRPFKSKYSWQQLELNAVMVEIDQEGKAVKIESIRRSCPAPSKKETPEEEI